MSFIYLASPYTHADPAVMEDRFLRAEKVVAQMLLDGKAVYSPIVHCHELAKKYDLPKDSAFWRQYNFAMLEKADELCVLMIEGWEDSTGVYEEVEFAGAKSIEVSTTDGSDLGG